MKQKVLILIAVFSILLVVSGCAKNRKSAGLMDDPHTHYLQGKRYFDQGDLVRARDAFKLSHSLNRKFGPAFAGLAMVDAAEGKFKEAEKNADLAVKYCKKKYPHGFVAKAIVIEYRNKGGKKDDWWKDAESYYRRALRIAPNDGEVLYRMGRMFKSAYQFRKAEDAFKANLEAKKGYEEEANREWKVVQDILRASPGTMVGNKIALVEKITRADIAALFISELELDKIMDKRKGKVYETDFQAPVDQREMQTEIVTKVGDILDIEEHWARNFIQDVQKFRIRGLEPAPDRKFYPDQFITRGEYSIFIEDILIAISGDKELATKHLGASTSRFPDVNPSAPFYNAICNAVDKNIMSANLRGEFNPLGTVSGPEALLIIRAIKELRK